MGGVCPAKTGKVLQNVGFCPAKKNFRYIILYSEALACQFHGKRVTICHTRLL